MERLASYQGPSSVCCGQVSIGLPMSSQLHLHHFTDLDQVPTLRSSKRFNYSSKLLQPARIYHVQSACRSSLPLSRINIRSPHPLALVVAEKDAE